MEEIQGAQHPNATQNPTTKSMAFIFFGRDYDVAKPTPSSSPIFFSGRQKKNDAEKKCPLGGGGPGEGLKSIAVSGLP